MNVAVGRVIYTSLLDEHGGFKSDLTIMRLWRTLPRRHGRRYGHDRKEVVRRSPTRKTARHNSPTSRRRGRPSGCGARARRDLMAVVHRRRRLRRGISLRHLPSIELGGVVSWPRESPTSASSDGRSTCPSNRAPCLVGVCASRAGPRARSRRASASTRRPDDWRRAIALSGNELTAGIQPRRGRHGPADGEK